MKKLLNHSLDFADSGIELIEKLTNLTEPGTGMYEDNIQVPPVILHSRSSCYMSMTK